MSRIGRLPISIVEGVTVKFEDGVVTVKGKLGELTQVINSKNIDLEIEDGKVTVVRKNELKQTKAMHGLYRMLVSNMVTGVSKGFNKSLIIEGVGYKASVSGKKLTMNLGLSHPVEIVAPEGIDITCKTPTEVIISGISKERVGHIAAAIRAKRPMEPYHGYGIRYSTEPKILKEGKTAGK